MNQDLRRPNSSLLGENRLKPLPMRKYASLLAFLAVLCLSMQATAQTTKDLNLAILKNDSRAIKAILKKKPSLRGSVKYHPLVGALPRADLATLKALLDSGVDPNRHYRGSSGSLTSPLIGLSMRPDGGLEAARLLDRYRVDWNKAGIDSMVLLSDYSKHKALLAFLNSKLSSGKRAEIRELLGTLNKPKMEGIFRK